MLVRSIPSIIPKSLAFKIILAFAGSIILALLAQLRIPVPFSPVPITGQTLGVLLLGGILGSKIGTLSVVFYIFEGFSGLPVFAGIGAGPTYLLGPTGGYLIGFIPGAFLTGYIVENFGEVQFYKSFIAALMGSTAIFVFGLSWLGIQTGGTGIFQIGFYPYLPGAMIKIVVASLLIFGLYRKTAK
jgi:biotin transport system substrate-specific component